MSSEIANVVQRDLDVLPDQFVVCSSSDAVKAAVRNIMSVI